ncbi:MAG: FecCD family ABC transporter permease [Devosia sp.]
MSATATLQRTASRSRFIGGLVLSVAALVGLSLLHIGLGSKFIAPTTVLDAFFAFDSRNFDHRIVTGLRLVRLESALLVGAALGMAGALLQAIIRNPIAEPGLLGLNAGAALLVVIATTASGGAIFDGWGRAWVASLGAVALFALVLGLASAGRTGPTPLKVTLAGVALTAFAGALTDAVLLLNENTFWSLRVWFAGSIAGKDPAELLGALPVVILGAVIAIAISGALNALALGEKAAAGLGVKVQQVRLLGLLATALLAGAAVAVAGPIGFLGLVVPHVVRRFSPPDMAAILPLSAIGGAIVLLAADLIARTVIAPQELATGIVTAGVGAPVFVYLVARYFR